MKAVPLRHLSQTVIVHVHQGIAEVKTELPRRLFRGKPGRKPEANLLLKAWLLFFNMPVNQCKLHVAMTS